MLKGMLTDSDLGFHPLFTNSSVILLMRAKSVQVRGQHRAFGKDLQTLSVAVIDNRQPMLQGMRAMLAAIGTGRIDTYESPVKALEAISETPPDLDLVASAMQPLTGPPLVRSRVM
jgi:PleD family two-component response regulator